MLKYLLLLFTLFPFFGTAQDYKIFPENLPQQDGTVRYGFVESIESASDKTLYSNAKQWIVEAFKNARQVVQSDDPDSKIILGKGNFIVYFKSPYKASILAGKVPLSQRINFTFKISCKEGRYKAEFYDFLNDEGYTMELAERYRLNKGAIELTNFYFNEKSIDQRKRQFEDVKGFTMPFYEAIDTEMKTLIVSLKKTMLKADW